MLQARPLVLLTLLLCALASPGTVQAADAPAPESCQEGHGSLRLLACSLAQKLGPAASGVAVTVIELKTDRELPKPELLRERVRSAVAAALGAPSSSRERSKQRVELALEKVGGALRVTAELRRATGLWQRIRRAKPDVERRAFSEVALDAELRALIPPPPLVVSETLKLKAPERGIVALACGPLGSEGAQELAIVTRSGVSVGRVERGVFAERRRSAWSSLSPVAPAPLREPIGSADITPEGTLRVGVSDRRDGLELSADFSIARRFTARLPVPGGGCAARDALGLMAKVVDCEAPGAAITPASGALDAIAGTRDWALGRALGDATLISLRADRAAPPALRLGAQLALGDADSDGDPELAFSADTLEANRDKLSLVSLRAGKLTPRFELPAPEIRAIAICQRREGAGMAPIVLATGDELWLIR